MGDRRLSLQSDNHKDSRMLLALGALGVVFGDIGTSPLYAFRECFNLSGTEPSVDNILGILSLIFWALTLVISVKYMMFVMRADNKGEGGILSLMALVTKNMAPEASFRRKSLIAVLGLAGAALLYGDGVITPAISVLSAVEGLKVVTTYFEPAVVPITLILIAGLFFMQFVGTGRIGFVFGPIIFIWFIVIGALGAVSIFETPEVIKAINPYYAFQFLARDGLLGLAILGTVFLVCTGGEALYADMGHFGRSPINISWFGLAMPGLVLNYFGQGALIIRDPLLINNPFYNLAPKWTLWPLVILATLATITASQALISGVFSLTKQAVQLGYCPRLSIIHTSRKEIGQIYIPFINWALLIAVMWLVMTFKTSSELAHAYGLSVTGTMLITTILAYEVARHVWGWGRLKAGLLFGFFLLIDSSFFIANALKVFEGGWVPLAMGASIYLLMSTWAKGRKILAERLKSRSIPMGDFIQSITTTPPKRVEGSAIYMTGETWGVPVPLLHNLKHNKVMHSTIGILTIKTMEVPFVSKKERVKIETLAPHFHRIVAQYGFTEIPKIKHILDACREEGLPFSVHDTTFVLGRETILPRGDASLSIWREKIFAIMARNAERPTAFFKIPPNQVIEVGIQVEI